MTTLPCPMPENHGTAVDSLPNPLLLAGATASGKSAVAVELACRLDAVVVNADPFQAWQGMPILTAQPGPDELARVAHHLYGVIDPTLDRDANGFAEMVRKFLAELAATGTRAIVVSGSGLYLRALTGGIDHGLPAPSPELRAELEQSPLAALLAELLQLDPVEYDRIDKQNPRRVVRAVEICRLTGQTASSLRRQRESSGPRPHAGVVLDLPSDYLKARVKERTDRMVCMELVDELAGLDGKVLSRTAGQTLGLEIARDWRAGRLGRAEAVAAMVARTWQYARRQRTWFRGAAEFSPHPVGVDESPAAVAEAILARFRA